MAQGPALFEILLEPDVISLHEQLWIAMDVVSMSTGPASAPPRTVGRCRSRCVHPTAAAAAHVLEREHCRVKLTAPRSIRWAGRRHVVGSQSEECFFPASVTLAPLSPARPLARTARAFAALTTVVRHVTLPHSPHRTPSACHDRPLFFPPFFPPFFWGGFGHS